MVMLCQVCECTYYLLPSASLAFMCSLAELTHTLNHIFLQKKKAGPHVESPMHSTRHSSTNTYVGLNCVHLQHHLSVLALAVFAWLVEQPVTKGE